MPVSVLRKICDATRLSVNSLRARSPLSFPIAFYNQLRNLLDRLPSSRNYPRDRSSASKQAPGVNAARCFVV